MIVDLESAFDAYHAALHRYVVRLVGDPDLAADAAQEAFLRLAERPPRTFDNLKAWLYTVATNYAFDSMKVARRRSDILSASPERAPVSEVGPAADISLERHEKVETVRAALDQLRAKERTALLMRAEGFSYREIGTALDVSSNSVGVIAARGLRKLAAMLQPYQAALQ